MNRNFLIAVVSTQLEAIFRSFGGVRVEAPPLLPRTKAWTEQHLAPQMQTTGTRSSQKACDDAVALLGETPGDNMAQQFHREMLFLDRHGTPLFMPRRLVLGLARSAPAFLASGPAVTRRFCFQNAECCSTATAASNPGLPSNVSSHFHAFYDVQARVFALLEPDMRNTVIELLRLPLPSSTRAVERSLVEAELMIVALQVLRTFPCASKYAGNAVLFLPALLHELIDVSVGQMYSFAEHLRWASGCPITKQQLQNKLALLVIGGSGTSDVRIL